MRTYRSHLALRCARKKGCLFYRVLGTHIGLFWPRYLSQSIARTSDVSARKFAGLGDRSHRFLCTHIGLFWHFFRVAVYHACLRCVRKSVSRSCTHVRLFYMFLCKNIFFLTLSTSCESRSMARTSDMLASKSVSFIWFLARIQVSFDPFI